MAASNCEVQPYPVPPPLRDWKFTLEGNRQRIEKWRSTSCISDIFLVVVTLADGKVIGDGGFESIDRDSKTGDAGIMLNDDPAVRGKGYAVEALKTTFDYGFGTLGLEKIRLGTLEGNTPMRMLLEKKFILKGEPREAELGRNAFILCRRTIGFTQRSLNQYTPFEIQGSVNTASYQRSERWRNKWPPAHQLAPNRELSASKQ